MIYNVYNIRDERQGKYGVPIITQKTSEQVSEDYSATIENIQASVARYQEFAPEKAVELMLTSSQLKDCVIYHVGTWDNESGAFSSSSPVLVCRISDFFREVNKNA